MQVFEQKIEELKNKPDLSSEELDFLKARISYLTAEEIEKLGLKEVVEEVKVKKTRQRRK